VSLAVFSGSAASALTINLAELKFAGADLRGIEISLPESDALAGQVAIQHIQVLEHRWSSIGLRCAHMALSDGVLRCERGRLTGIPGLTRGHLTLEVDTKRSLVSGRFDLKSSRIEFRQDASKRLTIDVKELDLGVALALLGDMADGVEASGRVNGQISGSGSDWRGNLTGENLTISDASGMHAAEGLVLQLQAEATVMSSSLIQWKSRLEWQSGAAFWNPWLLAAGWRGSASGRMDGADLHIDAVSLAGPGLAEATGSAEVDLRSGALTSARVSFVQADLAELIPRFVLPVVFPGQDDRWRVAGMANGHFTWRDGALQAAGLTLDQAGFSYLGQRVRVGPVSGELPWRRGEINHWKLDVEDLRWQQLAFAPFSLTAEASADRVTLAPARLPLLDGAVVVDAMSFEHGPDSWQGQGSLYSEPISLPLLTEALGMPTMKGTVSISVPGISVAPERIALDGTLVVSVFDGYLQATGLEVSAPFGLSPLLTANRHADHLDLAQLTQTFSFGAVSGFIDADVNDLVLAKWKPVRFDANVVSSAGDYERRISQRAVENITALGGAGAMAAVQRSVLRLFNDFGYREIGLSCRLRGNVCQMAGIDGEGADSAPFKVVAGGGIPALDVIGYNRRVDWAELIERLLRVTSDGSAPIVQ